MRTILDEIRQESVDIFEKIHEHPFVQQIHEGTLPFDKFEYYSEQDDLYLEAWADIILSLVQRLYLHPLSEDPAFFADLVFIQTHLNHVKQMIDAGLFNPKRKDNFFVRADKSELVASYLEHLQKASQLDSFAIGLASLFGCYDLYRQIGVYSKKQALTPTHPYYSWLSANYDGEFVETAERIFKLTQRVTEFEYITGILTARSSVIDVASRSYQYEWDFFMDVMRDRTLSRSFSR